MASGLFQVGWNPKFTFRPYQKDWCRDVTNAFEQGIDGQRFTKLIGGAGTGAGKTIMCAGLIYAGKKRGRRALFLADRDELTDQARKKIHKATGIIADIEKAESRAELGSDVTIGSVQTMQSQRRLDRFPPDAFDDIYVDECHLSVAPNWQRVLSHFDGHARVLGVTATISRGDKKALLKTPKTPGGYYEAVASNITLFDLIRLKALVPITVRTIGIEIDCRGAKSAGDGDQEDVAEAVEPYWDAVIDAWLEHAQGRPTLVFHPSRASSKAFTARCQARGITSKHVDGDSPDRKQTLQAMEDGRIQILNNAQLLTTGYDCPRISCIINLRVTKVKGTYQQMIGRGTRLCCPNGCFEYCECPEAKRDLLILDFLWQFAQLGVMRPADLLDVEDKKTRDKVQKALEAGEQLDIEEIKEQVMGALEQAMIRAMKGAKKMGGMVYDARVAAAVCDIPALIEYEPAAAWEMEPPTEGQLEWLSKHGIDPDSIECRGHAHHVKEALIARYKGGKASVRQIARLAKAGYQGAAAFTFEQAQAAMEDLKRHNWVPLDKRERKLEV